MMVIRKLVGNVRLFHIEVAWLSWFSFEFTSCTPGIRWPMLYYNPEQYSRLEFCSLETMLTSYLNTVNQLTNCAKTSSFRITIITPTVNNLMFTTYRLFISLELPCWLIINLWPIQVQIPLHLHCYSLLNILWNIYVRSDSSFVLAFWTACCGMRLRWPQRRW